MAYVAAGNRFFDGHLYSDFCDPLGGSFGGLIKITEVYENLNLPPKCSPDSYYQCMANHFKSFDFGPYKTINGSKCQFTTKCTPFSLPFADDGFPLCDNEMDKCCYQAALSELMNDEHNVLKDCKKLCLIKEFKLNMPHRSRRLRYKYGGGDYDVYLNWIRDSWDWSSYDPIHSFVMEYSFELDWDSKAAWVRRRDHRSHKPYKTVYKEYLLMTLGWQCGRYAGAFYWFLIPGHVRVDD